MRKIKGRTRKLMVGGVISSLVASYAALGAAGAFPTNDDDYECDPCPWYFTLPNGSCMIRTFCGPR